MALPTVAPLKAPFPYFGGKSRVASLVWERFGDVRNYVEPFFGSGAVLLARPTPFVGIETVNDADGMLANFWRAVQSDPEAVARWADWPVNENDLHARHAWLVARRESLQARLEGDPDWHDPKIAGWWVWGLSCWIAGHWCSGRGPWRVVDSDDGPRLERTTGGNAGAGVNRQLPHLGSAGQGVKRQRPHLGRGRGVKRQRHDLGAYLAAVSERLRRVRVCCGDWSRVCGDTPTVTLGLTAVFLDPPYAVSAGRDNGCYSVDSDGLSARVREWAIERGGDPRMRICLAGYEGEHDMPDSWTRVAWKTQGGYGNRGDGRGRSNANRERLWFSPHCLPALDDRPLIRDERA